ncbi:hypothetical protein B0H12DRAFT_1073903 [Mycena haematopus]|nr:hypothetical protein B0H12DRAFT_1073903 [Mycena haematopus]
MHKEDDLRSFPWVVANAPSRARTRRIQTIAFRLSLSVFLPFLLAADAEADVWHPARRPTRRRLGRPSTATRGQIACPVRIFASTCRAHARAERMVGRINVAYILFTVPGELLMYRTGAGSESTAMYGVRIFSLASLLLWT